MADDKPIIVIKKKGGHGGAHGGAWKIAYADFVTAMMAFFMVMWLLSTAETATRKAIASYFRRPGIFEKGSGTPLLIGESGILEEGMPPSQYRGEMEVNGKIQGPPKRVEKSDAGADLAEIIDLKIAELKELLKKLHYTSNGQGDQNAEKLQNIEEQKKALDAAEIQKEGLEKVANEIKKQILGSPELKELLGAVDVKVDADGLNIEIMDTDKSSMFALGSATILPEAQQAFQKLADILNKVPNSIDILGHTDAKPFRSKTGSYTNWELSADRANAARKMLEAQGLSTGRITSVVGRADTELHNKEKPEDASNRRITMKLRFYNTAPKSITPDSPLLKDFNKTQQEWAKKQKTENIPSTPDPIHSMTVKDVIDQAKKEKEYKVQELHDKAVRSMAEKDKLPFSDNPALRPSEFFDH